MIGIIRLTNMYSMQSRMFVAYDRKNKTNTYVLHVEKNVFSMVCAS